MYVVYDKNENISISQQQNNETSFYIFLSQSILLCKLDRLKHFNMQKKHMF